MLTSEAYGIPPSAEQKGSDEPIDAGDDRMQQTQYIDGNVWGELDDRGHDPRRHGLARRRRVVQGRAGAVGHGVGPATSLAAQGYVAAAGNYLMYPAHPGRAQRHRRDGVEPVGQEPLSERRRTAVLPTGATSRSGPSRVAAAGTANYDPNADRWGDYSWAVLDPSRQLDLDGDRVHPAEVQPDRATDGGTGARACSTCR